MKKSFQANKKNFQKKKMISRSQKITIVILAFLCFFSCVKKIECNREWRTDKLKFGNGNNGGGGCAVS